MRYLGTVEPNMSEIPESEAIYRALGQLALAAGQAEAYAAQGLCYLLTERPGDEETAAQLALEFRSFSALHRALNIALRYDVPLARMLSDAKEDAEKRSERGDPMAINLMAGPAAAFGESDYVRAFIAQVPSATAVDYLKRVGELHERRNQCVHALGIDAADGHQARLYRRAKSGAKATIDPAHLMAPCVQLRHWEGISMASAIEAVALELAMGSLSLVRLPMTVQWHRRRGSGLDLAPLVDHYMSLARKPLDEEITALKDLEASLQSKIAEYESSKEKSS